MTPYRRSALAIVAHVGQGERRQGNCEAALQLIPAAPCERTAAMYKVENADDQGAGNRQRQKHSQDNDSRDRETEYIDHVPSGPPLTPSAEGFPIERGPVA